jgi:hypothetical protein
MRLDPARGRMAFQRDLRARRDLGPLCPLAFDDPFGNGKRNIVDALGLLACDIGKRVLEILRKARHVDAAAPGIQVGVDVEGDDGRADERFHAHNACAVKRQRHGRP